MTQQQYLVALQTALVRCGIEEAEAQDILRDYAERFASLLAEGQTEGEAARTLGEPLRIALELGRQRGKPRPKAQVHKRVLAALLDILIMSIPFLLVASSDALYLYFQPQALLRYVPLFWAAIPASGIGWISAVPWLWRGALVLAAAWFVFSIPVFTCLTHGRSPGKRLMGLRVLDQRGNPARPWQIFMREWVGKLMLNAAFALLGQVVGVTFLMYVPSLVALGLALFTGSGRSVWDYLAGTRVEDVAILAAWDEDF